MGELKMSDESGVYVDFWRQTDLVIPDDLDFPITIIGAGGIGSPTALLLAKMGCHKLTVWDPDRVESHNLPNQFYRLRDIGQYKVQALAEIIKDFTGVEIATMPVRFTDEYLFGVVVSGVDSMETRKEIWKSVKVGDVQLYIEARMGAEIGYVYPINPSDSSEAEFYETTLYSSSETRELPCTARAISYNVFVIASIIAALVKKYAKKEGFPFEGVPEVPVDLVNLRLIS